MIKINLLPVRAAKKRETAIQQITISCAVIVLVAVVVLSMYGLRLGQISATKKDITAANDKIAALKTKIGKLEELKKFKEQVTRKLDVLAQLRKNKSGPAQRLATLSDITPEKLWLTGYTESADNVKVMGMSFSEDLIAQFMRNIQASNEYTGVELVLSEQNEVAGTKLKRFELTFKLKQLSIPAVNSVEVPKK
jgi:type IV pilus assembly protein PilN